MRVTLTCLACLACALPALAESSLLARLEAQLGPDEDQVGTAEAAVAYQALLAALGPADRPELVAAGLAYAAKDRDDGAALALDLLRDTVARDGPGDVAALGSLLRGSPSPFDGVLEVYAALPWSVAAQALGASLAEQAPRVRARAACLLAELAPLKSSDAVLAQLAPLASDAAPEVRLAYLQALATLPADLDPAAAAVAALVSDTASSVARRALRVASTRDLAACLPAARARAADAKADGEVRVEAMLTLARCGDPGPDGDLLRGLLASSEGHAARVCLAWLDPAAAAAGVEQAIDAAPQDEALYRAIPALGVHAARLVARNLSLDPALPVPPEHELYDRRVSTLEALTLGPSHPVLAELLYRFCLQEPADKPTALGPNEQEFGLALRALVVQANEHARELLANLILKRRREGQLYGLLLALAELGGPTKDGRLRGLLAGELTAIDAQSLALEPVLAAALSRVAPETAQDFIAKRLRAFPEDMLEWMRLLARAGDAGPLRGKGLRASQAQWTQTREGSRRSGLYRWGLDLLSAGRYPDAVDVFRQALRVRPGSGAAYNVACALALQGSPDAALRWLRRAVRLGYDDPAHILLDADLASLRALPSFRRLVLELRLRSYP